MSRHAVNGNAYNVERAGSGPPLVLLHGFTGGVATWTPLLPAFTARFETIAIDLPGHGASDAPDDVTRYRIPRVVDDLVALVDQLGIGRATWLGYSMGGRVALHFAVAHAERVSALVLEGASPGIRDAEERRSRVRADAELAASIERDGIAAFVERWEALPLFASQSRLPAGVRAAQRQQRLTATVVGLANSLRGMGHGVEPPLHDRLRDLAVPVLLLAGELDTKFAQLAREMDCLMPRSRVVLIPGAGHAAHLEQPARFLAAVFGFLADPEVVEEQVTDRACPTTAEGQDTRASGT